MLYIVYNLLTLYTYHISKNELKNKERMMSNVYRDDIDYADLRNQQVNALGSETPAITETQLREFQSGLSDQTVMAHRESSSEDIEQSPIKNILGILEEKLGPISERVALKTDFDNSNSIGGLIHETKIDIGRPV